MLPKREPSHEYLQLMKIAEVQQQETPSRISRIVEQMEYTRLINGYTSTEFSDIIGLKSNGFAKAKERKTIRLEAFLNFCFIFGYNISDISDKTKNASNISPTK